jgi:hypothetical protein
MLKKYRNNKIYELLGRKSPKKKFIDFLVTSMKSTDKKIHEK